MLRGLIAALAAGLIVTPAAGAWTWPANGPVLQQFVLGADPYAAGQHRGVDIGAPAGGTVLAPAGGTVSFAGTVPVSGRSVTIQTPDGYSVTLTHLGSAGVQRAAEVVEGEPVGTIGPSGQAEHPTPYLHLGIRRTAEANGYLDPLLFLPVTEAPAAPAPTPAPAPPAPPANPAPASAPPVVATPSAETTGLPQPARPAAESAADVSIPAGRPTAHPAVTPHAGSSVSTLPRPDRRTARRHRSAVTVRVPVTAWVAPPDRKHGAPALAVRPRTVDPIPAAPAVPAINADHGHDGLGRWGLLALLPAVFVAMAAAIHAIVRRDPSYQAPPGARVDRCGLRPSGLGGLGRNGAAGAPP